MAEEGQADVERESLPAHVALCHLRYAEIKRRMMRIELAIYVVLVALLLGPKEAFEVAR